MDILKFLTRKGMSQTELAKILGVIPSAVNNWTREKAYPKYEYIKKMFEMGARVDELFTPEIWESIKNAAADEIKGEVSLTPEECAAIVRSGLDALKGHGAELPIQLKQ